MKLVHRINESIELIDPALDAATGLARWRYVYGGKPKPFFHPLRTPAGHNLSSFEPHDHPWHRGLWFTIKFVNDENFWEEREAEGFGTQRTSAPPSVTHGPGERINLFTALDWVRPDGESVVLREQRQISYEPLKEPGAYAIDLFTILSAQADVKLDRTPFGTKWGGYGGLTFRGDRNWQETRLLFPDGSTSERPLGVPAAWCDLSGKLDGGVERSGGVAIFDHPRNTRHPSPWYGKTGPGHYINAALLFHEGMDLAEGQTLALRYRVVVHDGIWDVSRVQKAYDAYCEGEQQE